ncbi:unnamed protein product [Lactuca virosa]|uniref:non-specific serine/threonine protein kinase n=1 Tax=Lactuca virosa TaxID=75947 RepID=A0AAU9NKM5_9ASTR|nr:unnamed protein product [Lactuca virosa]
MGWFPCSGHSKPASKKKKRKKNRSLDPIQPSSVSIRSNPSFKTKEGAIKDGGSGHIAAQTFTFRELAAATKNFRGGDCLLGEGGFGRVYKGRLESSNQIVAIKQLDRNGLQGNREFLVEVLMLGLLHHPNLVNLIGYCADGDQRLLVYEYMPLGSLDDHLHDPLPGKKRVDWNTRMKIAAGAAKGLEYLHDKAKIITGRKAIDNSKTGGEQNLVAWARPLFKDRRKFCQIADPSLEGQYPTRGLFQALAVAAMCVQDQPNMRPVIADVVTALTYLASQKYDPVSNPNPNPNPRWSPSTPPRSKRDNHKKQGGSSGGSSGGSGSVSTSGSEKNHTKNFF